MAKPPAGAALLFGALAKSASIKQRKNGNYRMVLKGVDQIDWFTDRPNHVAGQWPVEKLVNNWRYFFGKEMPNAQVSYRVNGERHLTTFEMFGPRLSNKNTLSCRIEAVGKSNLDEIINARGKKMNDVSLFVDDADTECFVGLIGVPLVEYKISCDKAAEYVPDMFEASEGHYMVSSDWLGEGDHKDWLDAECTWCPANW
jgi:hypothetical protein